MELQIRSLNENDLPIFSGLLQDVAKSLEQQGQALWQLEAVSPEALLSKNSLSEMYLGVILKQPVATMILQQLDTAFWPHDPPGEALYLHKLAITPAYRGKGISQQMLAFAKEQARALGLPYLRLDTAAHQIKLNTFYQKLGFLPAGQCKIGEFAATLYELKL